MAQTTRLVSFGPILVLPRHTVHHSSSRYSSALHVCRPSAVVRCVWWRPFVISGTCGHVGGDGCQSLLMLMLLMLLMLLRLMLLSWQWKVTVMLDM
jgi:hypothetical protein